MPVESFDETLMDNVLVDDDNEYDSDDSDDSQNVSCTLLVVNDVGTYHCYF